MLAKKRLRVVRNTIRVVSVDMYKFLINIVRFFVIKLNVFNPNLFALVHCQHAFHCFYIHSQVCSD